jgi:hypothetical protein
MELSEILKLTPKHLDKFADQLEQALSEINCEVSSEASIDNWRTNSI